MLGAFWNRPYSLDRSPRHILRRGAVIGFFVFVFLWFFQPFGLNTLPKGLVYVALGYGLVSFGVMTAVGMGMHLLPRNYYTEKNWTVGREILWTMVNLALIGLGNILYSDALGLVDLSWQSLMYFELYTVAVGIFPVAASVLLNEARLHKRYARESAAISRDLHTRLPEPIAAVPVRIPAETQSGDLMLPADALLLVRAADNYVEVFFVENDQLRKVVLRSSLKAVESALATHPQFMRCHKGHIVNLQHIEGVSGNAQGYKLHLPRLDAPVPVSRQLNQTLRERLSIRP